MKTIRRNVFETNSSSCHCLTVLKKDDLLKMFHHQSEYVIHIPDTGEYNTDSKFEILAIGDAMKLWNECADKYNETYESWNWHCDKYDSIYKFLGAIESYELSTDAIFGKFMTYKQMMACCEPTSDMKLDVTWWNND